jgi:outer membrane receptor protein involved in Fe transport
MDTSKLRRAALATIALTLAPGYPALAQQLVLEEVIVTAQKRVESLQDVPIAVSAVSGEKINDIGITGLEELTLYTPNVNINSGRGTPNLFIRGVGSGQNSGFEQSVGMYIDGVYSGRGQLSNVPITMDLERVEILKGPQGILFGKNTIGGAINITTAKPTDQFEGYADALYSPDDGEQLYHVVVSGPIAGDLAGRLAVRYEGMDGWWDNKTLNDEGPDKDNWYARGSLRWDASDTLEVHFKYEYGDFDQSDLPAVVYESDFAGQENFAGTVPFPVISDHDKGAGDFSDRNSTETDVAALTVNWDLAFATLTSITAWSAYDMDRVQNTDIAAVPAIHRTQQEQYDQYSQEIRLVSPGGETIDWIVGAYYQQAELEVSRRYLELDLLLLGPLLQVPLVNTLDGPTPPSIFDQDSDSWAIFLQGTWNITDRVRVAGGVRYDDETKKLDKQVLSPRLGARFGANTIVFANPANNALIEDLRSHTFFGLDRSEDQVTWSGNVQWDIGDATMVYASVGTGYKSGGYDESYSNAGTEIRLGDVFTGEPTGGVIPGADPSILEYQDESVLAYELGAKMSLLDGAAELNLALFRMEYDDLQVSSLVGDVFKVGNAGEATSQGFEADGRWLLGERLILGGSIAYLDAEYDDFDTATCTVPQEADPLNNPGCLRPDGTNIAPGESGFQNLEGEPLVYSPDWSANLFVEYAFPLGNNLELRLNADANYRDSFYSTLDLDPATRHDSYTKYNARLALAAVDDKWSVAIVGKNLTDEETNVFNNDVPATASNSYYGVPERPRSFAVQARYRFD